MTVRLVLQYDSCGAKNLTIHSTRRADLLIRSTPRPYRRAVVLRKRLKKALSRPSNSACFQAVVSGTLWSDARAMERARRGELLQEVAARRAYFPLAG